MKYIGYYDCEQNKGENRNYVLSATNKMTYIASTLARNGVPVEIISASGTLNTKPCPGKTLEIAPDIMLKLFPSMGTGGRIKRVSCPDGCCRPSCFLLFQDKCCQNCVI